MKRLGRWITALAVATPVSVTALEVSGLIATSMTWRTVDSPLIVTANATVAQGATLTVEPGVEVRLVGRVIFTVAGRMIAEGTETRPIRFVRQDPEVPWRRLDFLPNPGVSRFVWCGSGVRATPATFARTGPRCSWITSFSRAPPPSC